MEGARGPVGLSFLTVLGLLCSLPCVRGTFLRFEPGYEYQYRYQSRAHVHGVDSFTMEARVGYTCVEELSEGQEIKLNVIALTMQSEKGQGVAGHRWDLSKWFSFVMTPRGEVLHVKHERERAGADEEGEGETVAIKKGLAALLAARLHHHSEQAGVKIVKTGEAWRYDVQEMGHEGAHNATYHATPTPQGITFTKVRHSHPVSHAAASYNKTMHYHGDLKMFHAVEIKEHFDVMADPPTGYDPYIKGQKRPDEDNELPELPSMTGEGHGKLQFLTKIRVTDVRSLVPPDVDMVNTSLHVHKVEEKKAGRGRVKKVGEVMDQITGKLTCMRTPPHLTESKVLQECFHSLVDILRSLANRDVTTLALEYLGPESRVSHYQRDQEHMLDAIWAVETEHAQNEVTRTVLLSDTPAPGHVERVLYLIGGSDRLPSESIIQTLVSLTLKPEEHADLYQKGELRHRLVLVLGTVIGHLNHSGQTGRASALAKQLQDMLGLHDPHTFRQKRSTMTEAESIDEDQWKVVLLESLGNARLDQSYEHIVSHVNSSNSQWVKRAGVHALRHYHHDHAADVLLLAALYDEHETVRFESAREYLRHPASRVSLLTTDPRPLSNSSTFDDPFDMELKAVGSHHRRRRDLFEELELLIQSPSVEWQKIIGSSKIGASFGLTIRNALDIKIGLLSGHGKVNVFDEAFGQVNLGFMGINVDIMRLRLCFKGHASYNLNLFQEYDVDQVTRVVELFDKLKAQTVGAISDGITLFRDILQGDPPVADVIKEFGDAIKNLPNKMLDAGKEIHKALDKISQYDDKKLPPFIIKLKNLVHKVSNLINDIRSDVTGFYNKLMTATVVIPYGAKQIFLSVENIIDSFDDLHKDPKSALSTVTGSTLTVGVQVKAMVEAVKEAKEAAFFLKKEKPYWWDLRAQTRDLLALAKEVVKDIKRQGPAWVKAELKEVKDGIEQFSSGSIDAEALKQQIVEELASLPEIVHSLSPLNNLGDELQEAFSSLFDLVTNVHKAYVQLRDGARKAKQFIERVFGPRVHKKFPRVTRTPGGGCAGKGFYPSSLQSAADPEYSDDGVDLLKPLGSDIVAPVPGIVYLSGQENQLVVESRGGSPKGALFVITHVKANDTVKLRTDSLYTELKVVAGQVIGQVTRSPCPGFNHIHLAIKKGNASIDPTRFLEPRLPEMPKWIQECDDYKYVFKGRTLAAGSLAGLAGRRPNDTSPARTPAPQKPSSLPADKNPSTKLDQDISQSNSVSKKVKDNKTKAKDTAAGSKDNALKTLLESATAFLRQFNVKDLKMGALVKFIHALDFQDSLSKLTNVFQTIQAMLNNKPCKNPNAMSDEDLRTELRQQGKSTTGSRDTLIKTMRQRSDRCPMLSLALPKQLYCTLDPLCLGIQCCLDVRVALFRKVYNMYLRLDPCSLALVVGIQDSIRKFEQTFGPDFALNDIYGGGEFVEPTGITIDALNSQLYLKGKLEKEDKEVVLSVGVSFCQMEDSSDCITDLKILDRAVMPLPVCGPDGSIYFPKVDMKRMLKNQKDKFKANAKQSLSDAVTFVADQAIDLIPCLDSDDNDHSLPCARPDAMSEETLTQTLQSRGLQTSGTAQERIARLEEADRTCTVPVTEKKMVFPAITNSKLARQVYIRVNEHCLGVKACVDIPIIIPGIDVDYSRSVHASISLDTCMPTITVSFESCSHEIQLFDNNIDLQKEYSLSDLFTLKASVKKSEGDDFYSVGLGLKVMLGGADQPPIIDAMMVEDLRVPIPGCADFVLPGSGSLRQLALSAGNTLSSGAVRFFMKVLKLDTVLTEGTCEDLDLTAPADCPWSIDVQKYLPDVLKDKVTCVMTSNCLGVTCCLDVSLKLPLMQQPLSLYLPFSFVFSPCDNMKVHVAFGAFSKEEQLLNYEFGKSRRVAIGKGQYEGDPSPLTVTFTVDHYRTVEPDYDEGFKIDLNIRLCFPFDEESVCLPDDTGFDVMKGQEVPVCSPATLQELRNFNLTAFLEDTGQPLDAGSLTRSVALTLLNKFGITDTLMENECDLERAPYSPAVDGWRNECPVAIQQLPKLGKDMACHLSMACNRVDCCIRSSFLGLAFHTWVDLNCDLYLQAGIERLASPKLYVLGGEIDWQKGIRGELNISEAFQIEYVIRKGEDHFVVDVTVKLCFDGIGGECQLAVTVMKGTRIPQLGCDATALSYFSELFTWRQCVVPTGDSGCPFDPTPALKGRCVLTDGCRALRCCVPVDLGFLGTQYMQASFEFDRCSDSFVYRLERKSWSLSLAAILDVQQEEEVGSAIKFSYVVGSHVSGYTLDASLELCTLDAETREVTTCFTYDVIPGGVTVYYPSSHCTRKRRRRQASNLDLCEDPTLSREELMLRMLEVPEEDVEQCMAILQKKEESRCEDLQKNTKGDAAAVFSPKAIMAGLGAKNPSTLLVCPNARLSVDVEGGDMIFSMLKKVKDIQGRLEQAFVPGAGLTGKGAKALAFKMADMTIGELQAYVMAEGVDPELAFQLMKDMKELLYSLYSDIMSSITGGEGEDLFKSFDLSIQGDFSVPRQYVNFFTYQQFFLVGGIVPMTFKFSAGMTSGMGAEVGAKVMEMQVSGRLKPFVSLRVDGSLSVGALLLGELRLTGYICEVTLPSEAAITFSKFPLDLELTMDMELKPLSLSLAALVTLEINLLFETIRKTLFRANIFYYETPSITKRVLSEGQKEPDTTPPRFTSFENGPAVGRRSPDADRCVVRQLAGLDYTEPSVEVEVAVEDDKSQPTRLLLVGTSPGVDDLLTTEMGGPSTILRQALREPSGKPFSGQPVYFTVRATNDEGVSRDATCSLDTYDVTLPQGRLVAEYRSTSNRHVLSGSVVVHEDSRLLSTDLAVGLGKGQYASGVRSWQPVDLTDRHTDPYDPSKDPVGHVAFEKHFTGFREGRLVVPAALLTRDIQALFSADCAKQCMILPESKCMSFNYHSGGHCELLATIAGHDHHLAVATNYLHYERLGVGLAHEFTLDLPLVHNSLYFFNLFLENSLNYINFISSEGTIVDLTPPHPGPINITSDTYEIVPCEDNIPTDRGQDWLKWCRGIDPSLPNHRILHDGPGSATLFNGHSRLHDLRYTKANTYVSANWDSIHDYESGILGYSLTVGRDVCEEWLHPHHDPHRHLLPLDDDDQWTHIGVVNTENGLPLPDAKYYITIRALNEVENGGPLSTTICHTTPYVIDTSPPIVHEVYSTTYDEDTYVVATKYNATDVHSDIHQVALCLGYTVLNCGVLPWQLAGTDDVTEQRAEITSRIPDGVPVWVRLRVENGVELQAVGHALHPIIVDITPPLPGDVYDGPVARHDLAFSKDQYQYCANWNNFADPESGIAYYMGAVTSADGQLLTNLTSLDRRSHMTCMLFDSPPLLHSHTYRFLLYAFNGGHKQLNVSQSSDGVLIDLTPPETGDVVDGVRPNFDDVRFSVHQATVASQWRGFSDPESDLLQYDIQVQRAANLSTDFQILKPWENMQLTTRYESHQYQLQHRDVIRTVVRATNGALNTATQSSDSFLVDLTPPRLLHLWDGLDTADVQFQSDVTHLHASFEFVDEESGLDHFKYQVYQTQHGHRVQIMPPSRNGWIDLAPGARSSVSVPGLALTPGLRYFLRVAAVNQAGSVATYDTDGVTVDTTPPSMQYVHVGVLSSGEEEVVIEGHVLQSDPSGIKCSWLAVDLESSVRHYQVAVGTSEGSVDILDWQDRGKDTGGYIGGLSLQLTNSVTNTPLYYVSVRAVNGAGDVSAPMTSNAIKVVQEDAAGVVTDGGQNTVTLTTLATDDSDYQSDRWTVTAQFSGFTSHQHGLRHFDWALGTAPGARDVMDFTTLGIIHDEEEEGVPGNGIASGGVAQTVLALQAGQTYYSTVRAFSNGGRAVQSVSDGFTVDTTPPRLALVSLSRETNSSELLPSTVVYQREADAMSAEWTVSDTHSDVASIHYAIGTYPGADDITALTEASIDVGEGALPSMGVSLNTEGRPNILTLWAENSVGLKTQLVSPAVVADITPPEQGEITCPLFVQPHSAVQCQWVGFGDAQSSMLSFTFFVGTETGLSDVIQPVTLSEYVTRYTFTLTSLQGDVTLYASVTATNVLGLTTTATSSPIVIDVTPPVAGVVVELRDTYSVLAADDSATSAANQYICESAEGCLALDVECQESMTSLLVAWSAFEDPETSVLKYEVAVGTTPGGGQLRTLEQVPQNQMFHMVKGLNLMGHKQIFATVKATNGAGASTTATSNGVYLSYLSQGLSPPGPVAVLDGDSTHGDLDFQTSLTSLSGRWTVEGDACPAVRYQWAVERVDGHREVDFYDTEGETSILNDGLQLADLETYYQLVRVTNALGYSYTLRSDGITIHHEPLIPGQVFDGSNTGFDLNYQAAVTKVSANWRGFGSKVAVGGVTDSQLQTENAGIMEEEQTDHQKVIRYEVALGTDRRYDNTRDNVVPWTDVGINTSVTFYDLNLTPLHAVYYFTVRAYSASNSRAEVTSNGFYVGFDKGVTGGRIDVPDYVSSNSSLEMAWDSFYSEVGMFLYYVAVSTMPVDNSSCQTFTDGGDMSDAERQRVLDIADRLNTGEDTYVILEHLTMAHDTDVHVHVIGVDRAGMCRMISKQIHIDVTPPTAGLVKCGPYYDMALAFAASSTEVTVDWKSFADSESPLTSFTLELMMQPVCDVNATRGGDVVMAVPIGANYSSYIFRLADQGQELTTGSPYFVRVTALNEAGLRTEVISAPLLYDNSLPVPGHVVDGPDFLLDRTWVGSSKSVTASILHLATPQGMACPSRLLPINNDAWTLVSSDFSRDNTGRTLDLVTRPNKASFPSETAVKVTLTRDTNQGHMYSATLLHDADIANGGTYELDIQSADGDGNAVTSVTLWDGDADDVIHYDFTHVVETEYCMCCFNETQTSSGTTECMEVCHGCTPFVSDYQNRNTQVTDFPPVRRRRSTGVHQLTETERARMEAGETLDDVRKTMAAKRSPACGMQLYTLKTTDPDYITGSRGRLVLWCTFGEDVLYEPKHVEKPLSFDPSANSHHYMLRVFQTADEEAVPTRCVTVTINEESVASAQLCGIPTLSPSTRLALSVWNWKNFLSDPLSATDNGDDRGGENNDPSDNGQDDNDEEESIALWQTFAIFSHVVIPAEASKLCRYGNPFRGGGNPIVRYEAAIGSAPGLDDVVPFRQVHSPCLPCVHDCDEYECDPTCDPSITVPLTLTLDGLDLPLILETSDNEVVPLVYYFTVKAVLGSGRYTLMSSDGFSIDTSPPVPDITLFFYLDAAQGEAKPVEKLFASNSTIQVLYNCRDNESSVVEYEWAIGTTPGGQEVQNYTSTGFNPTGLNDELYGVITHNTRYFISVTCTNGAGLQTVYEDHTGIVAFIEPLTVDDVSGHLQGTEPIGHDVVPATAAQSSDAHSISMTVTVSQDLTVDLYYFSIGSRGEGSTADIFPAVVVAHRVSGVISIRNGNIYKNDELMFPLRAARQGFNGTADQLTSHPSDFYMEPNRELFAFLVSCNEAQCTQPQLIGSVVIHSQHTVTAVSTGGGARQIGLRSLGRRKRSGKGVVEEEGQRFPPRLRRSADQVFLTTPDGLQDGQTVMLTQLTQAELTTTYDSMASASFVSYLTDPTYTLSSVDTVDRILVSRATYSPDTDVAFSLLSVGQIEMPGPMRVTFPFDPTDTDSTVQLLHWNPDLQKWQRSSDTCKNETDTEVKDLNTTTITVKVCNTYGSGDYFAEQTLFLLSSVNNTIPNDYPQLSSPSQVSMLEDEGTLVYEVETMDAEGDVVTVSLDSAGLSHDQGDVTLTPNSLLLFTPCADCSGVYQLKLLLVEEEVQGITPNTATATLTVNVTSVNDAPVAFLTHHGASLLLEDPTAEVPVLVEQNQEEETTNVTMTCLFGAYDVDLGTALTFTVQGPTFGTLHLGQEMTVAPPCSTNETQDDAVPCQNMSLPHDPASLAWKYMTLTYHPDEGFHGYDTVRLLATDEGGLGSEVITVVFGVMEMPCENGGTCIAKDPNAYSCWDARRVEDYDQYYQCQCSPGFRGPHCQHDQDDCFSNPCQYPYTCVDLVNGYTCRCADDNPRCDGLEGWMVAVIVIACLIALALVLVVVFIWAFRTGRLKWHMLDTKRPGSADSQSHLKILEPSAGLAFSNQAFHETEGVAPPFPRPPQMLTELPAIVTVLDQDDSSEAGQFSRRSSITTTMATQSQSAPSSPKMSRSHHVNDPLREIHLDTFGMTVKPRRFKSTEMERRPSWTVEHETSQVMVSRRGHLLRPEGSRGRHSLDAVSIGSTQSVNRPITPVETYDK